MRTALNAMMVMLVLGAGVVPWASAQTEPAAAKEEAPAVETPPRLKDRGPTALNNPPSGLWGSSPDDKNDKGLPKATGSAYNYTHIALSSGVIVLVGIGLLLLIRRNSAARASE